jgi:hypothetical protein
MSSPGQIFITGVVILANARAVDPQKGNRNIAFDINFPVKDGKRNMLGLLRYFTPENRGSELEKIWDSTFTEAFIVAKVTFPTNTVICNLIDYILFQQIAAMPETGIPSELIEDDVSDYACVGDITEVITFIPLFLKFKLIFIPNIRSFYPKMQTYIATLI